jgi:hypothetical protein
MSLRSAANISIPVAATLVALWGSVTGCSDDPAPPANTAGTGTAGSGAGTGGSNAGAGGSPTATAGTSGSGGAAGGAAGAPAGDPTVALADAQCMGIGTGDPCPLVGTCANRPCGLADTGSRNCVCGTNGVMTWMCTSCAYPMGADQPSILIPPGIGDAGALEPCVAGMSDGVICTPDRGDRCLAANGEVCACWLEEDPGVSQWDCDNKPSFWP